MAMRSAQHTQRVLVAADAAQAEAVQRALLEAGIQARIAAEPDGAGGMVLEIHVPIADAERATEIIESGQWPRLA